MFRWTSAVDGPHKSMNTKKFQLGPGSAKATRAGKLPLLEQLTQGPL